MSDVADILDKAADLIEPEGAWTCGAFARDARGRGVSPGLPKAICFCMAGAISRVAANDHEALHRALTLAGEGLPPSLAFCAHIGGAAYTSAIARFNDAPDRTQEEVVARLRSAALKAREQSK